MWEVLGSIPSTAKQINKILSLDFSLKLPHHYTSRENSKQSGFYSNHAEIIFVVFQLQSKYWRSSFCLASACQSQFGLTFHCSLLSSLDSELRPQQTTRLPLKYLFLSEFVLLYMLCPASTMLSWLSFTVHNSDRTSLLRNFPHSHKHLCSQCTVI